MGRAACTEPQCLYSRAIPLLPSVPVQAVHFTFTEQLLQTFCLSVVQFIVHKVPYFKILCVVSSKAVFVTCQHTNTGDQVTVRRLSSSLHKYIGTILMLCNDSELAVASFLMHQSNLSLLTGGCVQAFWRNLLPPLNRVLFSNTCSYFRYL
jgi:hypothetical protein